MQELKINIKKYQQFLNPVKRLFYVFNRLYRLR